MIAGLGKWSTTSQPSVFEILKTQFDGFLAFANAICFVLPKAAYLSEKVCEKEVDGMAQGSAQWVQLGK